MKKLYFKIEEDTEQIKDACFFEEGTQPENYIADDGIVRHKVMVDKINMVLYEGATSEDISEEKIPVYMNKLQALVTNLRIRAKGAAIGKKGTNSYIVAQQEFYEIKYQQCINPNNSQEVEDLLQNEADEFGMSLVNFKTLVIDIYTQAKVKYELFMRMIERCRTKIQTLIENYNWQSADTAFAIIETLDNVDEAQTVMNQILAL